jgi:lactoylglutathione lyase
MIKLSFLRSNYFKTAILIFAFILPHLSYSQTANQPVFNHAALCAKDLKKTAAFYSTVLQLKKISNPFNDSLHVWFKIGEGLALHVIHGDCPATVHDIGIHLCFSVPSLDAFIHHLDQLHVSYSNWTGQPKIVQLRADGIKQIYFQDPDGFWIEVNDAK